MALPLAFWMSQVRLYVVHCLRSAFGSAVTQRGEDVVSGRMMPTLVLAGLVVVAVVVVLLLPQAASPATAAVTAARAAKRREVVCMIRSSGGFGLPSLPLAANAYGGYR